VSRDVKAKEGTSSPYSVFRVIVADSTPHFKFHLTANRGQGIGGTDKVMDSSDVAAAVSVPKPDKERLAGADQNPRPVGTRK
jgi:translation initiation factor 2B subunit (eIF-2B alpha/beta/delta family)